MEEAIKKPPGIRRWFRFSLRTLVIGLTIGLVILGTWLRYFEPYRHAMIAVREVNGSATFLPPAKNTWRRSFYDCAVAAGIREEYLAPITMLSVQDGQEHRKINVDWLRRVRPLQDVSFLTIYGARLGDAEMKEIATLKKLTMLHLGECQITADALLRLADMPELNGFMAGDSSITDDGLANLRGCKNLWVLSVSNTYITDVGLQHLKPHKNLKTLFINGNVLDGSGLAHLRDVGVESLHAYDTRISPEHFKAFCDDHPGVTIERAPAPAYQPFEDGPLVWSSYGNRAPLPGPQLRR